MNAIADAKAEIKATKQRFSKAVDIVLGSPIAMAVAAVFTISFGSQLIYARDRLPPIGGLTLAQVGLPSLDLGRAGDALKDATDAAIRQGGLDQARGFLESNSYLIPYLNGLGFAAFAGFLAWTLYIQARAYRGKRQGLA